MTCHETYLHHEMALWPCTLSTSNCTLNIFYFNMFKVKLNEYNNMKINHINIGVKCDLFFIELRYLIIMSNNFIIQGKQIITNKIFLRKNYHHFFKILSMCYMQEGCVNFYENVLNWVIRLSSCK